MIITLDEAKQHMRVDSNDDDNYINLLINTSEEFIKNVTGRTFDSTNNLAKIACLYIVGDLYDNRQMTTDKMGERVRNIINMILTQLSLCYNGGDTI